MINVILPEAVIKDRINELLLERKVKYKPHKHFEKVENRFSAAKKYLLNNSFQTGIRCDSNMRIRFSITDCYLGVTNRGNWNFSICVKMDEKIIKKDLVWDIENTIKKILGTYFNGRNTLVFAYQDKNIYLMSYLSELFYRRLVFK